VSAVADREPYGIFDVETYERAQRLGEFAHACHEAGVEGSFILLAKELKLASERSVELCGYPGRKLTLINGGLDA
jgi:hypothetical protein